MTKNAYIHIPFCKSKCHYCSFVSYTDLEQKEAYLIALKKQIETEYEGEELSTLYFGGGTPSLLNITDYIDLLQLFKFKHNAEITVEINPETIYLEYLEELYKLGVNRVSIGAQTFDDKTLKTIGRRHNSEQILAAVKCAKDAKFNNISLDFIYGLPDQDTENFLSDLKTAVSLGIQHISLYGLKIEEGCYFHKNLPNILPDLDLQAEIYLQTVEFLKDAGFKQYEISNFSRPGFESRHNLNYWDNNSYYGFGCAACGYIENVRYSNEKDLKKYIKNPIPKASVDKLTQQQIMEEAIFLGLRKSAGINIEEINRKFGIDFEQKYAKILRKYCDYFNITKNGYALTLDGMLVSNEILAEFIQD